MRRHLLFCQKLGGQLPILPTRHLRPWDRCEFGWCYDMVLWSLKLIKKLIKPQNFGSEVIKSADQIFTIAVQMGFFSLFLNHVYQFTKNYKFFWKIQNPKNFSNLSLLGAKTIAFRNRNYRQPWNHFFPFWLSLQLLFC